RQQSALEHWLLNKGLLLLTASAGDQQSLLAEIHHKEQHQQLPLASVEQAPRLILQHLREAGII
ncbi:MAG: hypothetical protein IBX50_18930, partial [Marinospirillum sp.]|uniref:hypothetical protein n=1 Tax=Marinospirillum sp. TaxID=2183934 RepID=UPI0019F2FBCF